MDTKIFKTIIRQMMKMHVTATTGADSEERTKELEENFEKLISAYFITAGIMVVLATVTKLRLM